VAGFFGKSSIIPGAPPRPFSKLLFTLLEITQRRRKKSKRIPMAWTLMQALPRCRRATGAYLPPLHLITQQQRRHRPAAAAERVAVPQRRDQRPPSPSRRHEA